MLLITRLMIVLTFVCLANAQAQDCDNAARSTRVFRFNPLSGAWRFDDTCSGATRQGFGVVSYSNHQWTITDVGLLALWDDRKRHGLAAGPKPNSDQWAPVRCRFLVVFYPHLNDHLLRFANYSRRRQQHIELHSLS